MLERLEAEAHAGKRHRTATTSAATLRPSDADPDLGTEEL